MGRRTTIVRLAASAGLATAGPASAAVDVIPKPRFAQVTAGTFTVTSSTPVVVDLRSADETAAARALTDRLAAVGLTVRTVDVGTAAPDGSQVRITEDGADAALGDEGYALDATPAGVTIRAPHGAGLFYGVQTLLQLMPPAVYGSAPRAGQATVPAVHIADAPRFKWRGVMLDVARHFAPKADVLRLLDEMAVHKLNTFHWHLTDDQGWRLEIRHYPRLTAIGAWRDRAGFGLDPKLSTTYGPDGRYGGFYTQADVRQVVAYAAARHITVVPEIEMPGHASAAQRAYPDFFVPATPPRPGQAQGDAGIFNGVYDPADERTFAFLQGVLGEVVDLFPGPFVHIGGDEVPKGPWANNPPDVAFMKQHGLASGEQLQGYFVRRVGRYLASRGKRLVGWDEILEGGLAPDATVMSWRGTAGGLAAARAGHDVVMTPTSACYLDYDQGPGAEPHAVGATPTARRAYDYEPVPADLSAEQAGHVLGVQGNLWTEYVPNAARIQYMLWPRAAALAEVGWTPAADRNWADFARRLPAEQRRLDAMGVDYRPVEDDGDALRRAVHADGSRRLVVSPLPGATARVTLDGTYPSPDAPVFGGPAPLPDGLVRVTARYFRRDGVATPVAAATFLDGRSVAITATLPADRAVQPHPFFAPARDVRLDDTVTASFSDGPQPLAGITVSSGAADRPGSQVRHGALEVSDDGRAFAAVAAFAGGTARADLGGKPIAAFRVRFTEVQVPRPIITAVALR